VEKDIEPQPTLSDIISNFFTDAPLISPHIHAWITFVRSTLLFMLLDLGGYAIEELTSGKPFSFGIFSIAIGTQALYIVVRTAQRVITAINSPVKPLLVSAAAIGATKVTDLIIKEGQMPPDVSRLPDVPTV
jgi:hypothetical protein